MSESSPTVSELLNQADARADNLAQSADSFLGELIQVSNTEILPDLPEVDYAANSIVQFSVFSAPRPNVAVDLDPAPELPAQTTFSIAAAANVAIPDLTAVAPTLDLPALPSSTLPAAPAGSPEFVMPDIPTAPTLSLPAVPTFAALALPDAPSIALPTFEATLPTDDLLVPSNVFTYAEEAYSSVLLDPLKAKLLDNLTNGGYGIETADEQAMFQRARDREAASALTAIDEAGRSMAARGFPLPPGELNVAIDRAHQLFQDNVSAVNREITLERSKLYVQNRQFTITEARELEQVLIGLHNAIRERLLNVAKLTVELGLAVYDALVKRYTARTETYRAVAAAFADRIRGELAKAEIYRTQIEAVGMQVQMQKSLVDVYRAQLDGINLTVQMYKTQMEAASIRSGIERQKLEAFRAQVEAYQALVGAKVAEFNMYKAGVEGQTAKVAIYEAEVRAYSSTVSAAKVRSEAQLGVLQAQVAQAQVKNSQYQTQIDAFKAAITRSLEIGRLQVDIYKADIEAYKAQTDGSAKNADLAQSAINAAVAQNTQRASIEVDAARVNLLAEIEQLRSRTEAVKFGSEKFFALLATSINAVQGIAVKNAEE